MRLRFATVAAVLSVIGLIAWLARGNPTPAVTTLAEPELPAPSGGAGGSAVPCAVPLAWRIARIDPGFGLASDEAEGALVEAMALWEGATGRPLFARDPEDGSPIRFVYDERQASGSERADLETALDGEGALIEEDRAALQAAIDAVDREASAHRGRTASLEARISAHNESVQRWNERGGAPADTTVAFAAAGAALDRERATLLEEERRLEARREELRERSERFQERIDRHNARIGDLERRFPPTETEAGLYREAVHREPDGATTVSREIRVHRFDDHENLVRVLAHELGHALGLGHAEGAGALMSEAYGREEAATAAVVTAEDVRALVALCPRMGG